MFLNFIHPPPPSKQCEKGKESSYGVDRFKHTTSAYLGRRTTVWMGLVPNGIEVASWISSSCRHCSVFLFCSPEGASVYPQTQHFPFDCSLGFRMVGGDSSSHRSYNTSICQKGQDLSLGRLGVLRTQPHSGHQPTSDSQPLAKLLKKISRQLCPMLIKWEIKFNESWKMVSRQNEEIPRK